MGDCGGNLRGKFKKKIKKKSNMKLEESSGEREEWGRADECMCM